METYEEVVLAYFGDSEQGLRPTIEYTGRYMRPEDQLVPVLHRVAALLRDSSEPDAIGTCETVLNQASITELQVAGLANSQINPRRIARDTAFRNFTVANILSKGRRAYQLVFAPEWRPPVAVRKALPDKPPAAVVKTALGQLAAGLQDMAQNPLVSYATLESKVSRAGWEEARLCRIASAELNPDSVKFYTATKNPDRKPDDTSLTDHAEILIASRSICRVMHQFKR